MMIGLVALCAIIATTLWLIERTQNYFDNVVEARDARAATVDLRKMLQDLELGQRGYLITGRENYLEPYLAARENVLPQFGILRDALAPYPQADEPMERLLQTIELKLDELDETIELARNGQREEAAAIVATDRGKELMDEARFLFNAIIVAADRQLNESVIDQRASALMLWAVAIGGGVIIVLVVGGAIWTSLRYTNDLVAAENELRVLNQGLEERVAERTQDLIRANEEVQRFAYIVTHDLRAPLVNIMGFTSELDETLKSIQAYVLADGSELTEQQIRDARLAANEDLPEAIGFIRSSTRKMDGLINAILKISRDGRRPIKPEPVNLEEMLRNGVEAIHHQVAEADGEVELDVSVPRMISDRLSLEQIFGNLLDNAVKYSASDRPLKLCISAKPDTARRVRIDIADNGRGIAAQDHTRVFDLFRRSGEQDKAGEGIGLPHVRTLVRNLGGDITLASELGKGTTFTILLPLDVRSARRSSES